MNDTDEVGKTVLGKEWPLEESAVEKEAFVESYIETGRLAGHRLGFFLGRDAGYYYIAWYLLEDEKVALLKCAIEELGPRFPTEHAETEMQKLLPEFPLQPIGLRNDSLERLVSERRIVTTSAA